MATRLGQKNRWWTFSKMITFMEVKGQHRSNVVNYMYAIWLPNLVRRTPDASLGWWWPSWRSKVNRSQCTQSNVKSEFEKLVPCLSQPQHLSVTRSHFVCFSHKNPIRTCSCKQLKIIKYLSSKWQIEEKYG